jgi:large subunit ribosomal protein L27Ae
MRHYHLLRNRKFCPSINIDKLFNIAGKNLYEASKKSNENIPVIDLVSKGYFKLLGGGQINVPVI